MQNCNREATAIDIPARQGGADGEACSRALTCKLKENSFNPSKDSPPNEFLNKLNLRFSKYYDTPSLRITSAHDDTK